MWKVCNWKDWGNEEIGEKEPRKEMETLGEMETSEALGKTWADYCSFGVSAKRKAEGDGERTQGLVHGDEAVSEVKNYRRGQQI